MASFSLHLLKSKIHPATVTHAAIGDEGSITVSGELLDAADIREHEQVHVWNVTRDARYVTCASRGPDQSGIVCLGGATGHLAQPGDVVILATFAEVDADVADRWRPLVVTVDAHNCITEDTTARKKSSPLLAAS